MMVVRLKGEPLSRVTRLTAGPGCRL